MKLSELLKKIEHKKLVVFHTPNDFLQINAAYSDGKIRGYEIVIRITEKCNLGCEYCFVDHKKKYISEKNLDYFFEMVRKTNLSGSILVFSGGEPTIHPKLIEYIHSAEKSNAKIRIQTNAVLFSKIELIDKLEKIANVDFFVSLPSSNEYKYNNITNSREFFRAVEGIRNISKEHKVIINHVLYKKNYEELGQLFELAIKEFNRENVEILISNIGLTNKFEADDKLEKYRKIISIIKNPIEKYRSKIKIGFTMSGGCSFPFCILNSLGIDKKENLFKANINIISTDLLERQFYKKKTCKQCKYDEYCQGFLKEYVELFGNDELEPVG